MSDEYIDVKNIKVTNLDKPFYQVQGIQNSNTVLIMEVGKGGYQNTPKVLINSFDFENYKCQLISCLYREDQINIEDKINMVQLKIYKLIEKEKNKIKILGVINYSFKINDNNNDNYLSSRNKKKLLSGEFIVTFINNKYNKILNKYDKFYNNEKIMEFLISNLSNIIQYL